MEEVEKLAKYFEDENGKETEKEDEIIVNYIKYAANCTGSKLSQCTALIFLMRLSHRFRQYQL